MSLDRLKSYGLWNNKYKIQKSHSFSFGFLFDLCVLLNTTFQLLNILIKLSLILLLDIFLLKLFSVWGVRMHIGPGSENRFRNTNVYRVWLVLHWFYLFVEHWNVVFLWTRNILTILYFVTRLLSFIYIYLITLLINV